MMHILLSHLLDAGPRYGRGGSRGGSGPRRRGRGMAGPHRPASVPLRRLRRVRLLLNLPERQHQAQGTPEGEEVCDLKVQSRSLV